jgi:hypothetical protein
VSLIPLRLQGLFSGISIVSRLQTETALIANRIENCHAFISGNFLVGAVVGSESENVVNCATNRSCIAVVVLESDTNFGACDVQMPAMVQLRVLE